MQTLTSRSSIRRRWIRFVVGGGAAVAMTVVGVSSAADAATTSTSNRPIGATGSVAALSGSSMEVQNDSSGQTTVSWTSTTAFSQTVSESVSSLAVGDCVSATGTASKKSKTTIAARSITVTTPTSSGSCTGFGAASGATGASGGPQGGFAFRGGGGFPGGESGGTRPSFPTGGSGSSNFRNLFASLSVAIGKVTAVKGSTVTLSGTTLSLGSFRSSSSSSKSKSKKPAKPKTQNLTITASSSTTVSANQSASSSDLAVGDCVSAFGPAASNGAVTATTVRITSTGGSSCTGFGGGFFGGGSGTSSA